MPINKRSLLLLPSSTAMLPFLKVTTMFENMTVISNETATSVLPVLCTYPAYHEFPPDAFTASQRAHGAIILHMLLVLYLFVATAIVCDDYFVSSLDKVCEHFGISEDVAGATFMAAGSSMPELFTAIIGVFITKGDVGIGTIVGSAVFNVVFVIGVCGFVIKEAMALSWWPLFRDSVYYVFAILTLVLVVEDGKVTWYESLIMIFMYILYIVFMKFNRTIKSIVTEKLKRLTKERLSLNGFLAKQLNKFQGEYEQFEDDDVFHPHTEMQDYDTSKSAVDEYANATSFRWSMAEAGLRIMMGKQFCGRCRFRSAGILVISHRKRMLQDTAFLRRQKFKQLKRTSTMRSFTKSVRNWMSMQLEGDNYDGWRDVPKIDRDGYLLGFRWLLCYPIKMMLYCTIPDCRKARWERYFIATFVISLMWIAVFSYVTVWMITYIGFAFGIPDSVMGITFLAAGTSVPDAMSSIFVARQGLVDMAITNCFGSNIFDILLGLSLPWFLKTAIASPGSYAIVNSSGMVCNIVLLFVTVILTVGAIHFNGWMLNRCVGMACLVAYACYVIISTMIECNVFGFVNLPMCQE